MTCPIATGERLLTTVVVMPSRRVPRPVLVGATLLVLLAVAFVVTRSDGDSGPSAAEVNAVELAALGDGEEARLEDLLDGQPLVLNFFAQWCQPCRQEMPDFEEVHQQLGDRVTVVGVALPPASGAEKLARETGVTYPTYVDPHSEVLTLFGGTQMPTTVFITPEGEVAATVMERMSKADILERIEDDLGVAA